jgi:NADH:ubiquinone oxidoreductase subunit 4 (subunit M)
LTWVTFLPLAGALLVLLSRRDNVARWLALTTTLADLALVTRYWFAYDAARGGDAVRRAGLLVPRRPACTTTSPWTASAWCWSC